MKIISSMFFGVGLCLANNTYAANDGWVAEEVLIQLQEIKKELKQIKDEIKRLDSKQNKQGPKEINILSREHLYMGDDNAKIVIVEFSDFQCPYCVKHHNGVFKKLKKNYVDSGKIRYGIMNFPLSFHQDAFVASLGLECAGKQNKYWEMHSELFKSRKNLKEEAIVDAAESLGVNSSKFKQCLKDPAVEQIVENQILYGQQNGVLGTPTFLVGRIEGGTIKINHTLRGAQSFRSFKKIIDRL